MRQLLFLLGFIVMGVSCSDFYVSHDYPVYIPAITKEQAEWIRFGLSDSLTFIDTAGNKKTVKITRRDTSPDTEWSGSAVYETLELHGTNYNYSSQNFYTEFNIDTLVCWLSVRIDSAKLFNQSALNILLAIDETRIKVAGTAVNATDSSVTVANKNYNTLVYINEYPYEPIQEVCVSPEFGILWIKFSSGDEWRNSAL